MEITVPVDDATVEPEPHIHFAAALSDDSVVWESQTFTESYLIGRAYSQLYGFTVLVSPVGIERILP